MVFLEILLGGLLLADVTSTLTCYFFHAVLHHLLLLFTEEQSTSISQVNGFSNLFLFLLLEDFTLFTPCHDFDPPSGHNETRTAIPLILQWLRLFLTYEYSANVSVTLSVISLPKSFYQFSLLFLIDFVWFSVTLSNIFYLNSLYLSIRCPIEAVRRNYILVIFGSLKVMLCGFGGIDLQN